MKVTRRKDGTQEVQVDAWADFRQDWQAAPPEHRVIFDEDRRPAVYRPATATTLPDGEIASTEPSYVAISPEAWARIRPILKRAVVARKRELLCATCGSVMAMTRELASCWAFKCEICKAVATVAKSLVGGTEGAGEAEVRPWVPGMDVRHPEDAPV